MPTAREKLAACAIGQHIHVLGGATGPDRPGLTTNERYDAATDSWTVSVPMPTGRRSLTAIAVGGKCFAIGGRRNLNQEVYDVNEAFDPESGHWTARASMPTARFYPASVVIGGKIFVVGGVESGTVISDKLEAYDVASDSWQSLPPMPTARGVLAAAAVDGKLYAIGGTNNPAFQRFATLEVFDPATNSWTTRASMPTARFGLAAVSIGGLIYAIGGTIQTTSVSTVEVYDPDTNAWAAAPPLNISRTKLAAAVADETIFSFGGAARFTPPHPGLSSVEALDLGDPHGHGFQINAGLNDAWFNPETPGQGFFITVFPDIGAIFLAWFTYDTERPPGNVTANLGEPGHRWLTAFGEYADNRAVLDIEVTSGGLFNAANPAPTQEPDGTIVVAFHDCNSATISYDVASPGIQGEIEIERIALDNVAICEALTE